MNIAAMMGRRTFLKSMTIFGGLAALFGIARPAGTKLKEAGQHTEHSKSSQGYQLTEHVKKYYETARL